MRMQTRIAIAATIVLGVACVLSATTGALAESPNDHQACFSDAFNFCLSAIPDRNRVFACLVENRNLISLACRTAMAPYIPIDSASSRK